MNNSNEEQRKNEIAHVMDLIQKLCIEAQIGLVPYKRKNGTLMVVIQDATNGKQYALIKNEEV